MGSGNDTKAEQGVSVAANRDLRRAVDKCLGDGIEREQVAEALVRMAETVHSEFAEERAEYSVAAGSAATAGLTGSAFISISSHPADRCRMLTSRASTVDCATSA
jgi:hypothetical protein